jgi:hypothetical protein
MSTSSQDYQTADDKMSTIVTKQKQVEELNSLINKLLSGEATIEINVKTTEPGTNGQIFNKSYWLQDPPYPIKDDYTIPIKNTLQTRVTTLESEISTLEDEVKDILDQS